MTHENLTAIVWLGHYIAYLTWIALVILIGRQIFKRNFRELKISSLYLINSVTFIMAWGLILELAVIVRAPMATTAEESIKILRNQADNFFSHFILSALIMTDILTILNFLYLKYFAKTNILKHTLALSIANLTILLVASYISTEWFYTGLLQEIYRKFHY